MSEALNQCRAQIDAIDEKVLQLISQRAQLAHTIGNLKNGGPVYRPEREAQVLRRLVELNPGVLSDESVTAIFRTIMSHCRALEKELAVAFLGPLGTYSEEAANKQFGGLSRPVQCTTIDEVFKMVEAGKVDYGALADQARTIRIPVHMVETISKYQQVRRRLTQDLGREPLAEELAAEMSVDVEKIHHIQQISQETVSLEAPVGEDDEDSMLGDFIEDEKMLSPSQEAARKLLKDHITEILIDLMPREQKILRMRFGLDDGITHTLEEVGKEFGVTRERIRQIEAKALEKIRQHEKVIRLKGY